MFTVSAPGKVILHGEHAVVYGKTALAASLDLRTRLNFQTNASQSIELHLPIIDLHQTYNITELIVSLLNEPLALVNGTERSAFSFEKPSLIDFPRLLEKVKSFVHSLSEKTTLAGNQESALLSFFVLLTGMFSSVTVPLEGFTIDITTDLTIESGMGSSASFGVCLSAALFHYIRHQAATTSASGDHVNISKKNYKEFKFWCKSLEGFDRTEKELICQWAFLSDRIMHGNPSGIDNSICTFGSIIQFRKGSDRPDIQMIPDPKILKVLLVHTKVVRDTGRMVGAVASRRGRHPTIVDLILDGIDAVTISGADILRQLATQGPAEEVNTKMDRIGELIDMNQSLLQALGVSHSTLERICSIVRSRGLHGKLTGAGGGGYAYVLLPPTVQPTTVNALKSELNVEGFTCQEVALGGPGVMLHNKSS